MTLGKIERYHWAVKNIIRLQLPDLLERDITDSVEYDGIHGVHKPLKNVTPAIILRKTETDPVTHRQDEKRDAEGQVEISFLNDTCGA